MPTDSDAHNQSARHPAHEDLTAGASHDATTGESTSSTPAKADEPESREFAIRAARMASDDKCTDVLLLDVRGLSQVTNYIVVATGSSARQMASVLDHIEDVGDEFDRRPFRVSKDVSTTWLLLDYVDVVVHLFEPNARAHYDLEMLWGDAPRVDWKHGHVPGQ